MLTGKGFGSTNLLALDRAGKVVMDTTVQVLGASANSDLVVVYKGVERESYSCAPDCERRLTLGDSPAYFTAILTQSGTPRRPGADAAGGALNRAASRAMPANTVSNCLTRCLLFSAMRARIRKRASASAVSTSFRRSRRLPCLTQRETALLHRMRRLLQARLARRFVRQQDGAAAVEFALVAAPFLALTVRHHGNGDGVLRRPDAGSRGRRLVATDHDRPGAERQGFSQAAIQDGGLQRASTACSIAPAASMST